jgi:hypothetical protein
VRREKGFHIPPSVSDDLAAAADLTGQGKMAHSERQERTRGIREWRIILTQYFVFILTAHLTGIS